ncbi:hypothetical protein HII36_29885 [Nonomuraea sp. NN258]|uniref:hypothetical protein n=1 Tax=Nonomuraea antri TaxID=2730852 RepID=UPI00156A2318|nr:hypothetical protein [Nonomuraea antri]NRQ36012.1 hypothetical protein [Nonomuraea antri]
MTSSSPAGRLMSYAHTAISRDHDARQRLAKSITIGPSFDLADLVTSVLANAGRARPYRAALDLAEATGDTMKGFRTVYQDTLREVIREGIPSADTPVGDLQRRAEHEGALTFLRDVGPILGIR